VRTGKDMNNFMRYMNAMTMAVGYLVITLWLAASLGVGDFHMQYGPANSDQTKQHTCQSGDSFWTRKKYVCDFPEWEAQQQ